MADDIWPVGVYRRWWRKQRTESTNTETAGIQQTAAPVDSETAVKTAVTLQVEAPVDNDNDTVTTAIYNRFNVIDPDNVDTCNIVL